MAEKNAKPIDPSPGVITRRNCLVNLAQVMNGMCEHVPPNTRGILLRLGQDYLTTLEKEFAVLDALLAERAQGTAAAAADPPAAAAPPPAAPAQAPASKRKGGGS